MIALQEIPEAPRPPAAQRQLTRSAALTFVSNLLQQGARLLTQFIVTPVLIQGLGLPLYGAWMMIQQTIGYLGLGDIRPMSTLKFTLAVRQHVDDEEEKRRLVGAALRLTLYTFPLLLIIGAVLVWFSPSYIRLSPEHTWALRAAMAVTVLQFALDRLLTLPSNVLVGMNLDYRSMGMSAASVLVSGVLTVMAVRMGFGLPGVAVAVALGAFIYSAGRFFVARRAVSWFGVSKPTREELKAFAKMSGWVAVAGLGTLLLTASDVLLLGIVLGPTVAAVYATTGAVMRFVAAPIADALGSGGAGISDLCGRQEWGRLTRVRTEMHLVTIAFMSVLGFCVIALNRYFLLVWTRRDVYGGTAVNVFLVVLTLLVLLHRTERVIATSMVELRVQTVSVLCAAAFALTAGALGAPRFGPAVMPAALVAGYLGVLTVVGRVIDARTGAPAGHRMLLLRPLTVAALLFTAAVFIERRIAPDTWLELFAHGIPLAAFAAAVVMGLGLGRDERAMLLARVRQALQGVRSRAGRGSA